MLLEIMCKFTVALMIIGLVTEFHAESSVLEQKPLDWWQRGVFYQIYPRSFKDSNGDGVGDLRGIAEKVWYLKDLGVSAIWFNPIFDSPGLDLGYDISNYTRIDPLFGTLEDLEYLRDALHKAGIRLLLDFVPNHTSDEHPWFQWSIKKVDPYTNYYVWKDAKMVNGQRKPPTNWISEFGGSMWKWNDERQQYFLHQFHQKQPDLNYECKELVQEMMDVVRFWLDRGVDGLRLDAINFMFEDPLWRDQELLAPDLDPNFFLNYNRSRTMDQPATYEMVTRFREIFDSYSKKDGRTRVMMTEAYTTLDKTLGFYQYNGKPGAHMPFNFFFITHVNGRSPAKDYQRAIQGWMQGMPAGHSANWVIGNHDNHRIAARYGTDLVDGMNMIALLLPGTGNTYYGDEIGMDDAAIRFDEGVDPQACQFDKDWFNRVTRDPERTPFQWDTSLNAGFSTSMKTWLPVNSNFWRLNLKDQMQSNEKSHYKVYKRLMDVRKTDTMLYGDVETYVLAKWVFAFTRRLTGSDTYVVVVNLGSDTTSVDLSAFMSDLPETLTVHTGSVNTQYDPNDKVPTGVFYMRPKASILLTTAQEVPPAAYSDSKTSGVATRTSTSIGIIVFLFTHRLLL
nr:PREDICTED: maltase A3-like [Bemisia tabaci]